MEVEKIKKISRLKPGLERIILIGNGFDRSLNMRTNYSHFIDWLVRDAVDTLIEEYKTNGIKNNRNQGINVSFTANNSLFRITSNILTIDYLMNPANNIDGFEDLRMRPKNFSYGLHHYSLKLEPVHPFMNNLFDFYKKNRWVDIEEEYFKHLQKVKEDNIIRFHSFFEEVKTKLKEYLETLSFDIKDKSGVMNKYRKHFFGNVMIYDKALKLYSQSNDHPSWYYFVNFNYTRFLSDVLDNAPTDVIDKMSLNHIHGNLHDFPMIFGYGNESGDDYTELEKKGNDYLENIKSTHYFNTTHYKDLLINLNSPYEVYIYGLSCGLSDHILLNKILENKNCKQIRVFYHKESANSNNFREIIKNITRVFNDKELMREKIISIQENDFIPQLS